MTASQFKKQWWENSEEKERIIMYATPFIFVFGYL